VTGETSGKTITEMIAGTVIAAVAATSPALRGGTSEETTGETITGSEVGLVTERTGVNGAVPVSGLQGWMTGGIEVVLVAEIPATVVDLRAPKPNDVIGLVPA